MPVIGGKQSKKKSSVTKVVKKAPVPEVIEEPIVEEVKEETIKPVANNPFMSFQPIRKRPASTEFLKQIVSTSIEETTTPKPVENVTETTPIPSESPVDQLVNAIVTQLDEKFVSREELSTIVSDIVDEKLKSLLVEPNKKNNKTSSKKSSTSTTKTVTKQTSGNKSNNSGVGKQTKTSTTTSNKPTTRVVKRK